MAGEEAIQTMLEAEEKYNQAKEDYQAARIKAQIECDHPEIFEGEYISSGDGHSTPEFRVCVPCGYAEEGWHCGYSFLTDEDGRNVTEVSREEALKKIRHRIIPNSEHPEVKFGRKKLEDVLA